MYSYNVSLPIVLFSSLNYNCTSLWQFTRIGYSSGEAGIFVPTQLSTLVPQDNAPKTQVICLHSRAYLSSALQRSGQIVPKRNSNLPYFLWSLATVLDSCHSTSNTMCMETIRVHNRTLIALCSLRPTYYAGLLWPGISRDMFPRHVCATCYLGMLCWTVFRLSLVLGRQSLYV